MVFEKTFPALSGASGSLVKLANFANQHYQFGHRKYGS
jgi:hypothetical protein